ncbi:hypothetical protein ACVBEQ_21650 [Nakamurella sp. GG22]
MSFLAELERYHAARAVDHGEAPGTRHPGGRWYEQMSGSISTLGLMTPLLRWRGHVIDGEMRLRICDALDPRHPAIEHKQLRRRGLAGAPCACGLAYRDLPADTPAAAVLQWVQDVHISSK